MRVMVMKKMLPLTLLRASPVLVPTVKPEKVGVAADAPLVILRMQEPSLVGAVIVHAPLLVMDCKGREPQSTARLPVVCACVVTFAPPETVWSGTLSAASVAVTADVSSFSGLC